MDSQLHVENYELTANQFTLLLNELERLTPSASKGSTQDTAQLDAYGEQVDRLLTLYYKSLSSISQKVSHSAAANLSAEFVSEFSTTHLPNAIQFQINELKKSINQHISSSLYRYQPFYELDDTLKPYIQSKVSVIIDDIQSTTLIEKYSTLIENVITQHITQDTLQITSQTCDGIQNQFALRLELQMHSLYHQIQQTIKALSVSPPNTATTAQPKQPMKRNAELMANLTKMLDKPPGANVIVPSRDSNEAPISPVLEARVTCVDSILVDEGMAGSVYFAVQDQEYTGEKQMGSMHFAEPNTTHTDEKEKDKGEEKEKKKKSGLKSFFGIKSKKKNKDEEVGSGDNLGVMHSVPQSVNTSQNILTLPSDTATHVTNDVPHSSEMIRSNRSSHQEIVIEARRPSMESERPAPPTRVYPTLPSRQLSIPVELMDHAHANPSPSERPPINPRMHSQPMYQGEEQYEGSLSGTVDVDAREAPLIPVRKPVPVLPNRNRPPVVQTASSIGSVDEFEVVVPLIGVGVGSAVVSAPNSPAKTARRPPGGVALMGHGGLEAMAMAVTGRHALPPRLNRPVSYVEESVGGAFEGGESVVIEEVKEEQGVVPAVHVRRPAPPVKPKPVQESGSGSPVKEGEIGRVEQEAAHQKMIIDGYLNSAPLIIKKKENSTSGDDKAVEKNALEWLNGNLDVVLDDLYSSLDDGLMLIQALEKATGESVGRYTKRVVLEVHKIDNLAVALRFLNGKGVGTGFINPQDILARDKNKILVLFINILKTFGQ